MNYRALAVAVVDEVAEAEVVVEGVEVVDLSVFFSDIQYVSLESRSPV